MKQKYVFVFVGVIISLIMYGCKTPQPKENVMFQALEAEQTGIHFSNTLQPTNAFNLFHYMYFYNGAGIGAGDFNNDGKIDLFFSANQVSNRLYLNDGKMHFTDVSKAAGIVDDGAWSTGVSVVDINNDGLLDIYVCRVGNYEVLKGKNQLLMCKGIRNGIPFYTDEAAAYGLDFSGFSTQATFFDYDGDGDLDVFLLNHSVHQNGTFAPRKQFEGTYHPLSGDRLYRNDGQQHFTDVTHECGINSSAISYGLGVVVADIDLDGWPDLYVGNDFHENDYMYINQHNGTFAEQATQRLMHTSQFSMGVDVADVTNDGYPEIVSVDMLPSDPYILKRSLGEDEYDIFNYKISVGYNYQYTRNNLQYNQRNGMFSEVGLYTDMYATDWSWAPLWMDFDNDGKKDLFISNGIPKRMNDMDYVNFVSSGEVQQKIRENKLDERDMALVNTFPEIKIPNRFFNNKGNISFTDAASSIANNKPTFSNGSVYADLDNDGDLDIVVNNIDDAPLIYENKSNDLKNKPFASLHLVGAPMNKNAIGAKAILFAGNNIHTYEKFPVHGFQSSMEIPLHIGLAGIKVDSAFLIWPDNSYEKLSFTTATSQQTMQWKTGLLSFDYKKLKHFYKNNSNQVTDITATTGINHVHHENKFQEFNRELLLPHMLSTEGPAVAVADINKDGLEDVFIGGARDEKNSIYLQHSNGVFKEIFSSALAADSSDEDVAASWIDINNDGYLDLIIASGGNEFYGADAHLLPRAYLNDGKAGFTKLPNAFKNIYTTQSIVTPLDFDNDGFMDVFIGSRCIPWDYGKAPRSYLLRNNHAGQFDDVTNVYCKALLNAGMVTGAVVVDINNDRNNDLVLCYEWGGIDAFIKDGNKFTRKALSDKKGWWNFILPVDINKDGHIDFIAGNLGLNSRLHASEEQPIRLYYNDFDDNGKAEQVLTYYLNNKELPFANKDELQRQMPFLKKKFLYAGDFAKASLEDIFSKAKLSNAITLEANYLSNALLVNDGKMNFSMQALPWQAQLTTYKDATIVDANNDGLPDVLLGGNYYDNNIQMGRNDADFGTLLINKGNAILQCENMNGLVMKGQVRHLQPILIKGQKAIMVVKNNDSTKVIRMMRH